MKDALAIRTILPATVATEQNVADATVAMEEDDGAVAEAARTAISNAASTSIASDAEQDNASKATQPSES